MDKEHSYYTDRTGVKTEIKDLPKIQEILEFSKVNGFDLDQVLSASEIPVVNKFNRVFMKNSGKVYDPDIAQWNYNIKQWLMESFDSKKYHFDEAWAGYIEKRFWQDPMLINQAPAKPGAVELSSALLNQKKEQFVVTSRLVSFNQELQPLMHTETHKWMSKWFPWIPKENIFVDTVKGGSDYKLRMVDELHSKYGMNVFFEDYLSNALNIVRNIDDINVVLVSKEYFRNLDHETHPRILKIPTMKDVFPLVAQSY
jgi:hypothetical protein